MTPLPDNADKATTAALKLALEAVNTWLATYADDLMDEEHVVAAHARIAEGGGTLAYIANVASTLRGAILRSNPDYFDRCKPHQPTPGVYDPIQHARNLGEL